MSREFHYAVFDIEAAKKWVKFLVVGFYDGEEYLTFNKFSKFIDYLFRTQRYDGWRIYAHYGGGYDFLFVMEELRKRSVDVRIMPRQGKLLSINAKYKRTSLTFADSYAILPSSLKDLTVTFDVKHKKKEFDFTHKRTLTRSKRLLDYLRNDTLGLYETLEKFFSSEFVGGVPKLTTASQSLTTFRKRFLPEDHKLVALDLDDEDAIRKNHYAGGRVEVFKGRGEKIRVYDVNSLYPFSMLQEMPCGIPKKTSVYDKSKIGFYSVQLTGVPNFYVSPLLYKHWKRPNWSKNYFLRGDGQYYLSNYTINYLKHEYDIKVRVNEGFVFPRREHLFNEFVETFYKIKNDNKGNALAFIAKLFLNSLYGKLGQTRWKDVITHWNKNLENFVTFDEFYGLMLVTERSKSKFILPYLAAYVTEIARLEHFKYMRECGRSIYYCDTDSIFTTSRTLDRHVSNEIGKLKFEGEWNGIFLTAKTYALKSGRKEKIAFKGFNPKNFRFSDFEKALRTGGILEMNQERVLSFTECTNIENKREEVRKGLRDPAKVSKVKIDYEQGYYLKVITSHKEMTSEYDRRMIIPSNEFGFDTRPFERKEFQ